jgi:hypothetical protein
MKSILIYIIFFSSYLNIGFSEILNLDKELEIKIPKNYHYFEINILEAFELNPKIEEELTIWERDSDSYFGMSNPKIIFISKNKETINLLTDFISLNGSKKIENQLITRYDKFAKKKGKNWARSMARSEAKLIKFFLKDFIKFYKLNKLYFIMIGNKDIEQDYLNTIPDGIEKLFDDGEIDKKRIPQIAAKSIKEFMKETIGEHKIQLNVKNFTFSYDDLNNSFVKWDMSTKWYYRNNYVIKTQSEIYMAVSQNRFIWANSFCITNCSKMSKFKSIINQYFSEDGGDS